MGELKIQPLYCDQKTLAKSMKLASVDVIRTTSLDIESHWYKTSGSVDLYFWVVHERIIKHQMNFFGQIIEWNEYDGLRTGFVDQGLESQRGENSQEMICFDEEPDRDVIQGAIDFLQDVKTIDSDILGHIHGHYMSYPRWEKLPFYKTWKTIKLWLFAISSRRSHK